MQEINLGCALHSLLCGYRCFQGTWCLHLLLPCSRFLQNGGIHLCPQIQKTVILTLTTLWYQSINSITYNYYNFHYTQKLLMEFACLNNHIYKILQLYKMKDVKMCSVLVPSSLWIMSPWTFLFLELPVRDTRTTTNTTLIT